MTIRATKTLTKRFSNFFEKVFKKIEKEFFFGKKILNEHTFGLASAPTLRKSFLNGLVRTADQGFRLIEKLPKTLS
jgi:uncharacterized Fe-S cluster-containing radical SAM superfamily enzyme